MSFAMNFHFFFYLDFHLSAAKKDQNVVTGENRIYCPINRHLGKIELFYDDMKSLYYVMLHYASFKLIWESNVDSSNDRQLAKAKNQFDKMKVSYGTFYNLKIKKRSSVIFFYRF